MVYHSGRVLVNGGTRLIISPGLFQRPFYLLTHEKLGRPHFSAIPRPPLGRKIVFIMGFLFSFMTNDILKMICTGHSLISIRLGFRACPDSCREVMRSEEAGALSLLFFCSVFCFLLPLLPLSFGLFVFRSDLLSVRFFPISNFLSLSLSICLSVCLFFASLSYFMSVCLSNYSFIYI